MKKLTLWHKIMILLAISFFFSSLIAISLPDKHFLESTVHFILIGSALLFSALLFPHLLALLFFPKKKNNPLKEFFSLLDDNKFDLPPLEPYHFDEVSFKEEKAPEENTPKENTAEKLNKANVVLQKKIYDLLDRKLLTKNDLKEEIAALNKDFLDAIKAVIKYDRLHTNMLIEAIGKGSENKDSSQVNHMADEGILKLLNELNEGMKEERKLLSSINDRLSKLSALPVSISEHGTLTPDRSFEAGDEPEAPATEELEVEPEAAATKELEVEPEAAVAEELEAEPEAAVTEKLEVEPEFEIDSEAVPEPAPEPAPVASDPNKAMSPDEIAALFATSAPDPEPMPEPAPEPAPVASDPNKAMSPDEIAALFAASAPEPEPVPEPAPVASDPNKAMSPDEIAALFAAPEPEPVPEPAPVASDPNKAMSPDEIAALFAASAPEPEPAPELAPEPAPVASDPNKAMSPDEIAALFASMGD